MAGTLSRTPYRGSCSIAAFSLLELLIVVTISLVMLMIGVPSMHNYVQDKRLRSMQHQLQADLGFARHAAVNNNQFSVICPADADARCTGSGDWHGGWVVFQDSNSDRQRQDTEPVIRSTAANPQLSIRSPQTRNQVRFSPSGSAPASNLSIIFCDQRGLDAGRKLVVSHSGRIRQADVTPADSDLCNDPVP